MDQHTLEAARVLMGDSLGFHIIFVMFGLTLPVLVSWFELIGIKKKDPSYTNIAKFWSKIMTVLVITGVISGTVIALQMSLVWPGILKFGGKVIGLPFMFETYAFLIEAIFLSLYMVTWGKVSQWLHWVIGLFVIIGSSLSAFMITAVNAWMNQPSGFTYDNGVLKDINIWHAVFNRTTYIEFFHSMPAYFLSVGLVVGGLYAFKLFRVSAKERQSKKYHYDWQIIKRLSMFAIVMFIATGIMGDVTGKYLAKYEATKLAAIELNYDDQANAPLLVGGVADGDGGVKGPHIKIPGGLSWLAGNSKNTVVKGLNSVPENERPPLYVHTLFDIKMVMVALLGLVILVYLVRRAWRPNVGLSRMSLLVMMAISGFGIVLVELGWMLTEIGRQPWAVHGFVTTAEATTKTHDITSFGYIFPLSYVLLFVVSYLAVRKIIKDEKIATQKGAQK